MASQRLPLLAALAWALLALPCFWAGEAHGIRTPCQQHCRYRKPPATDPFYWPGHWVPLMIIVGGCCGLAWCILFVGYEASQKAGQELPQLPAEEENIPEEKTPLPPAVQREVSRILFRRESQNSNVGNGNQQSEESHEPNNDSNKSIIELERKSENERLTLGRSIIQLSREAISRNSPTAPSQSTTQLSKKSTSLNLAAIPVRSVTQVGSNILLEKVASATQLEDGFGGQPENNVTYERVGSVTQLESQAMPETGREAAFPQDEALLRLPAENENNNPSLWSFMEKELEKLLQALRLRQPARSATSAYEEDSAVLSREDKAVGTDAMDVPNMMPMDMPNMMPMDRPNMMPMDRPNMMPIDMPNMMPMDMPNMMPMDMPNMMPMDMPNMMPMDMPHTMPMDTENTLVTDMRNTTPTDMPDTMGMDILNTMGTDMPSVVATGTVPLPPMPPAQSQQPRTEESAPYMQLIICEIPRSRSRSPVRGRGRGRKRRCASRRRK